MLHVTSGLLTLFTVVFFFFSVTLIIFDISYGTCMLQFTLRALEYFYFLLPHVSLDKSCSTLFVAPIQVEGHNV